MNTTMKGGQTSWNGGKVKMFYGKVGYTNQMAPSSKCFMKKEVTNLFQQKYLYFYIKIKII